MLVLELTANVGDLLRFEKGHGQAALEALTFVMANLIVDVLYTYLNPKITM